MLPLTATRVRLKNQFDVARLSRLCFARPRTSSAYRVRLKTLGRILQIILLSLQPPLQPPYRSIKVIHLTQHFFPLGALLS